jgi:hypothetical protein
MKQVGLSSLTFLVNAGLETPTFGRNRTMTTAPTKTKVKPSSSGGVAPRRGENPGLTGPLAAVDSAQFRWSAAFRRKLQCTRRLKAELQLLGAGLMTPPTGLTEGLIEYTSATLLGAGLTTPPAGLTEGLLRHAPPSLTEGRPQHASGDPILSARTPSLTHITDNSLPARSSPSGTASPGFHCLLPTAICLLAAGPLRTAYSPQAHCLLSGSHDDVA